MNCKICGEPEVCYIGNYTQCVNKSCGEEPAGEELIGEMRMADFARSLRTATHCLMPRPGHAIIPVEEVIEDIKTARSMPSLRWCFLSSITSKPQTAAHYLRNAPSPIAGSVTLENNSSSFLVTRRPSSYDIEISLPGHTEYLTSHNAVDVVKAIEKAVREKCYELEKRD